MGIPAYVPCAIVSGAFRGPRFVAEFQRRLVADNIALAHGIANYFAGLVLSRGPSPEELRSAAYEGLCNAALRYVEARGDFCRYAGIWIRREIIRRITAGTGPVSRPRNAVERAREIAHQRAEIAQELGEEISDEDLAERLVVPPTPRHHHQRRHPETAEELRLLGALLYQQPSELLPEHAVATPEVDLDPDLPVSPLISKLLDGWTVAEIAEREKWDPERLQERITREIRRFFKS